MRISGLKTLVNKLFQAKATTVLLFYFCIAGCTTTNSSICRSTSPEMQITSNQLHYSGKGAAAGMMLMGSMGSMGTAIGVAIDVGIGKDIYTTFQDDGYSLQQLAQQAYSQSGLASQCFESIQLTITQFGAKTISGDNDPVVVSLEGTWTINNQSENRFVYPEDFPEVISQSMPLNHLKQDGEATANLFQDAFLALFNSISNTNNTRH
jgi:hypothetical protein